MHLNLTNLKDLDYICQIAADYFERPTGLPMETEWLKRINRYRELFKTQIERLETEASDVGKNDEQPDHFGALVAVLNDEELIRLCHRFQKKHNLVLVNILSLELEEREGTGKATH